MASPLTCLPICFHSLSDRRGQYSHLLCFAKGLTASYRSGAFAAPDVFDRGEMLWPRGIGVDCAFLGLTFLKVTLNLHPFIVIPPFTLPSHAVATGVFIT